MPKMPKPEWEYKQRNKLGDIDLISEVRRSLVEAGLEKEVLTAYDNSVELSFGLGKIPNVQRFHLNKYLNLQLMYGSPETMNERFCLVADGSPERWLELVQKQVIPRMVKEQLPKTLPIGGFVNNTAPLSYGNQS